MVNRPSADIQDIAPVAAMVIGHLSRAPVFGRNKRDGRPGETEPFPPFHFVDFLEAKTVHQISHPGWNDDGLVGRDLPEAATVKVIEMGMGDQNKVDRGQVVLRQAGMAEPANHEKPVGPVRVDENVGLRGLNEKGGMADPGDAKLPFFEFRKHGWHPVSLAAPAGEEGGQKHIGHEAVGGAARAWGVPWTQGKQNDWKMDRWQTLSTGLACDPKAGSVNRMSGVKKAALREEMRARVARLTEEERRVASGQIEQVVVGREEWKSATVLGLYLSLTDEPQTRGLLDAARATGKKVLFPKIEIREGLTWWEVSARHLPETRTLWEPSPDLSVRRAVEEIELFLVPGRAFDAKGTRLGRGGGHYDRALSRRGRSSKVLGMFFDLQEAEELPREPHDISLPAVVTEKGWRKFE